MGEYNVTKVVIKVVLWIVEKASQRNLFFWRLGICILMLKVRKSDNLNCNDKRGYK